MKEIISPTNTIIKEVYKCKNKEVHRKEKHWVLVEGKRQINLALDKLGLVHLFYCPELLKNHDLEIDNKVNENKVAQVSQKVFEKISFKNNPDGYLAVFEDKEVKLEDLKLSDNPLLLILDKVEKPGNLGALARTALATGVDAIILTSQKVDPYNPKVISSSTGHSLGVDIVSSNKEEVFRYLKDKKIKIFATSIEASQNYLKSNFKEPCALVFGSEDKGLDKDWLEVADKRIIIPMLGELDSLNVSVSAAVVIYEVLRQRNLIDF
ncbi:MAG: TrmH family RNA methyltransferase [Parcubacteria group bacterium]